MSTTLENTREVSEFTEHADFSVVSASVGEQTIAATVSQPNTSSLNFWAVVQADTAAARVKPQCKEYEPDEYDS